jgi:membrane protein
VIAGLFTLLYKVLPDEKIPWGDVWVGGVVTALLFSLGKALIGLYLGNSSVASAYGAAGSLAVVLIWIYYSAQLVLFGAEFTQVYANRHGSRSQGRQRKPEKEKLHLGLHRQSPVG